MKGWVGLVGWPVADGLPTQWSPVYRLQAERRTGSVRRPKTGVLPTVLRNEHDRLSVRGVDKHIEQQRHSTTPPVLQAILAGAVYLQSHTLRYRSDEIQLVPDAIDSHPTDSRDVPRHHFARTWGVADCYLCNNCLPVCLVAVSRENYPSDLVENFQSSLFSSTWLKIIQQENNVIT